MIVAHSSNLRGTNSLSPDVGKRDRGDPLWGEFSGGDRSDGKGSWLALVEGPALVLVALAHLLLLAWLVAVYSPTVDEIAYLPAGLSHWELGRYELYRANPPLVRMIAAVPVLFVPHRTDWRSYDGRPGMRCDTAVGEDFIIANGPSSFRLLTIGRWACIPFSLLGAFLCWRWARDLYGPWAGLVALVLWCFCPNIIGNGALITPDVGAASLGLFAGYSFWRWLRHSSVAWTMTAGVALGLAVLAKAFWLPLFVLWPAILFLWEVGDFGRWRLGQFAVRTGKLGTAFVVALVVINVAYAFDGTGTRLGDYQFASVTLRGGGAPQGFASGPGTLGNRFRESFLASIPLPLPREFVIGLDIQQVAFESRLLAFLLGKWKEGGWWYYYILAMAFKIPAGAILLLVAALAAWARAMDRASLRDELVLLLPTIAIVALLSAKGGINRHFRYVLPLLPFLYIWASRVLSMQCTRGSTPRCVFVAFAVTWFVFSSAVVLPHSLSYFNEIAGGPARGSRILQGSNTDWGQNLFFLKQWIDSHRSARPLYVGWNVRFVDPALVGIDAPSPPSLPTPGWYVVGVNEIGFLNSPWAYFNEFTPVERIGYSMNVYHIEPSDLARWARIAAAKVGPAPAPRVIGQ